MSDNEMSESRKIQLEIWKRIHVINREIVELGDLATKLWQINESQNEQEKDTKEG